MFLAVPRPTQRLICGHLASQFVLFHAKPSTVAPHWKGDEEWRCTEQSPKTQMKGRKALHTYIHMMIHEREARSLILGLPRILRLYKSSKVQQSYVCEQYDDINVIKLR